MDCNKHKKIKQIVRLQQILKKWRKLANAQKPSNSTTKGIDFLKRTFTFSNSSSTTLVSGGAAVPKGFLAVCVGEELKRFVIPTGYLGHGAFRILLRGAEEEFGFQQEGVLRIPCEVSVFENILKVLREKGSVLHAGVGFSGEEEMIGCCSLQDGMSQLLLLHQPPNYR
ncbi:auxin-responsive protein SAUR72-like protein [Cinnamomum micranthum f. kanehirae]|uniref:Auxin-responsive protein SAUR72-like protein n=1 Tax=Cinnamomum micranthum f. kanehirae TaxID=337451 RepID=A0A443P0J5_9MAGN|nr:auxin-responsive protein SAUR72-like protein [Cinnamomum micranthum f. kanehirae]